MESVLSPGKCLTIAANGVAAALLGAGLPRQAKVAQYLRNSPEYLESLLAVFKAGFVPLNTNFRYSEDELAYLWDDSEASAVVFGTEFSDTADKLRSRLPLIRVWIQVGPSESCPEWAVPYEVAATSNRTQVRTPWRRSGDDLYLLYTGGTTGMPKGVMWRQDDLFRMLEAAQGNQVPAKSDPLWFINRFSDRSLVSMTAAPLMHGTASWFVFPTLARGGTLVTLPSTSLDPVELLDTLVDRRVKGFCIAGEAFIRPILRELEVDSNRWDLSQLRVLFSSGAMLSHQSKVRFLHFASKAIVIDGLGSSESGALARSITKRNQSSDPSSFRLSTNTRVIDLDGHDVIPGSGHAGRVAVSGYLPIGYYRDPEKTAETFVELDGRRHVISGDWAEVAEDGSITLLGRGSTCINTGGEKVFPEEVEEVLKSAAGVQDAGVIGFPDSRLGEVVTALVRLDGDLRLEEQRPGRNL